MTERKQSDSFPPLDVDGPSNDTRDAVRAAIVAELEPLEPMSVKKRALFVLGAAVASAALAVVSYGSMGLHGLAKNAVAVVVCGIVALLATLAIGGSYTEKGQQILGRNNRGLLVATLIVLWSLYLFAGMTDQALGTALAGPAIGCGLRSLVAGALGGGAMMWVWRNTDPWTPRISGALIGACAGSIASAGVGIPCAAELGGHLLIGHWIAVPLLALVGWLAAPRILAP
jgi:hypothetical protein